MYLEVRPNGSKYWRYKYRFIGKEKLLALGVYPETSLAEAREKLLRARKLLEGGKRLILDHACRNGLLRARKLLEGGVDPSQERKKKKALAKESAENTFEVIAWEWYANRKSRWRKRYAEEIITRLEKDIFPEIGNIPIVEIEPPLLLHVIRKIENRGAYELAKRQLQKCGEIFRYAIATGKALRDPSQDIKEALMPVRKEHFAAIDVKELPEFIAALERNDARLYQSTRNALKLIMLTFVRTSELINATWEEIDFDNKEWVIPAERMKMGKVHIVPLSRQAIEVLENQKILAGQWPLVFPSSVKPRNSISNNTILGALKRLGYQGRMTGHGFRALAMSAIKQELGYRHEVVDRQLAHVPKNKIDKAYDRALFLRERKIMMQEWADYLDEIANNGTAISESSAI